MRDGRVDALRALLREHGVGCDVSVAGAHGDIAVVHGATPDRVSGLADHIRALGFRHVTVDLESLPDDAV